MLKLNRNNSSLQMLPSKTLTDAKILERNDLQEMIKNNPGAFFQEMGQKLILVGSEIMPSEHVNDRIDLLAIDEDGGTVIIELKRHESRLQLLQALSYAAMISNWKDDQFIEVRSNFNKETIEDAGLVISDHLTSKEKKINANQRVILIAENFDYALLKTAEWLTETYGVRIHCYRIKYLVDGDSEFFSCSLVYPPEEIIDQASRVRSSTSTLATKGHRTLEQKLQSIESIPVRDFFQRAVKLGERTPRGISFRISGVRRFGVAPRKKNAYVWQSGRFQNDLEFWKLHLSDPENVKPVDNESCLSFNLKTADDFAFFENAVKGELTSKEFGDSFEDIDVPDEDL